MLLIDENSLCHYFVIAYNFYDIHPAGVQAYTYHSTSRFARSNQLPGHGVNVYVAVFKIEQVDVSSFIIAVNAGQGFGYIIRAQRGKMQFKPFVGFAGLVAEGVGFGEQIGES